MFSMQWKAVISSKILNLYDQVNDNLFLKE